MAIRTRIGSQTNWGAITTWYEGAVPGNSDTVILDEGGGTMTNTSNANTGQKLIIGPGFNGTLNYTPGSLGELHMAAGTGASVRISSAVTGFVNKYGGGELVLAGSACPALYGFNCGGITVLEACDVSEIHFERVSRYVIKSHASAIIDAMTADSSDGILERDQDQITVSGGRVRLIECATNDGAGGGLLTISGGAVVDVEALTAQTFDEVMGLAGVLSIAKSSTAPTFTAFLRTAAFLFERFNRAGAEATDSSPTLIGAEGTLLYGGGGKKG